MNCKLCELPISSARLKALPETLYCIKCVLVNGDVPKIKRHDDFVGEDVIETYYTKPSPYLSTVIDRLYNSSYLNKPRIYEEGIYR